jgi:hypothetical protein
MKHVDIAGDLRDLDLGLAQIRQRLSDRYERRDQQRDDDEKTATNDEPPRDVPDMLTRGCELSSSR